MTTSDHAPRTSSPASEPSKSWRSRLRRSSTVTPLGRSTGADTDLVTTSALDTLVERALNQQPGAAGALISVAQPLAAALMKRRLSPLECERHGEDVQQDVCAVLLDELRRGAVPQHGFLEHLAVLVELACSTLDLAAHDDIALDGMSEGDLVDAGPEDRLMRRAEGEWAGELLAALPGSMRDILILRVAFGLTAEQTAQVLGTTAGAVRVAQHRALQRLRGAAVDGEGRP
jgi:RNA polymerase sigma-70 factor (ECF subfamily)